VADLVEARLGLGALTSGAGAVAAAAPSGQ
jgi:hypothetical protein